MIDSWSPPMKHAMLASLVAAVLAAVPSYGSDPVVVVPGEPIALRASVLDSIIPGSRED